MRKFIFTTILLFLALVPAVAATLVQGEKLYADVHDCGTWYKESSTDFRLWYGEGESDYVDVEGSVEAGFLWSCDVERDDISRVQLKRVNPSDHSTVWNWSDIFDVESGKDVLKLGENCDGDCKWKTCTWYATTPIYVTPSTLTYTNSATWDPEAKTLKANVKVGDNPDRWMTRDMTFTGKTYNGEDIYSCKLYCLYGGVHVVQFQVYNGETQEGLKEYDKPGTFEDCWANIQNKIYNGTSWLTYGRDITIYAIPEATEYTLSPAFDVSTHVLLANVKIGSTGDGEWLGVWPVFEKTAYQYNQKWIYKATVFAKYNVICRMEFHEKESVNGDTKSQYNYNPASEVSADDIDGKIFGGWVSGAHTWYDYATDTYTVELDPNEGTIHSGNVTSYTYGEGATLPTDVYKWGCDFGGWYDNAELEGDPVTVISTSDSGNKDYYAKWTSIVQNYPIASHPEFLAAEEGDILVITVSDVQPSAAIYLYDLNYNEITNLSISATGTYTFPLSAASATGIRTYGLQVTGQNFTFSDVDIRYRKTIWTGPLSAEDNWKEQVIDKDIFSGLSGGDFLGFYISAINTGSYHQYSMRADYDEVLSGSRTETGIAIHQLSADHITALTDSDRIDITAQYLDISNLYSYTHTRVYGVTLITNSGTINSGDVTSYTFGTGATLPTNVTRTGYTFAGWYPDAEFKGERVYTISTTDYGAKTYYAKWTVNTYDITLNLNDGTVNEGNVTSYTYGVGATLPTDVTKMDNKFDGWYDNAELSGDAVTAIANDATGDKVYYAKWTSISETLLAASGHPEFLAAEEGDILVITVSDVQPSAQIVLKNTSSEEIDSKSISATGKHAFQLTAEGATALQTGVIITGVNYTKSSVALLYKKTIWNEGVSDETSWTYKTISDRTGFEGIADGDYLGFTVTDLYDKDNKTNQYFMQYDYKEFITSDGLAATGTYLEVVPSEGADKLKTGEEALTIGAKYLTLSELNRYITTRDYTVTLHTNDGTINAGDVTGYTYPEGATLPTDVTLDGYNFDGWYGNSSLTGDPVTEITTSDYGDKEYWAKWTSIKQTFTPAETPILPCAVEGDLVVVDVSAYGDGAEIVLQDKDGTELVSQSVSATGRYPFQLTAAQAASVNTGLIATGTNYTATVSVLLRKTIWNDGIDGTSAWDYEALDKSIFDDISVNDFLGVTINKINGGGYYSYRIQINNSDLYEQSVSGTGTFIHQLSSAEQTNLTTTDQTITIASGNSAVSALYRYVDTRVYTVTLNTNSGTINDGNVTSYTYPEGETLPTNVTLDGYRFDGWYDNEGLTGEPVTKITTSDYGNKVYYAKWTSISETLLAASGHPEFLAAEEGDILVITVSDVQPSAQIVLKNTSSEEIDSKSISATGKYAFQLNATAATALHTGMILTGTNYTGTVELLYRKTIWHGELISPDDKKNVWKTADLKHSDFTGIANHDYVGFTVSHIVTDSAFHQYNLCAYKDPNTYVAANNTTNDAGTYIDTVKIGFATHLLDKEKSVFIAAQNLTITDFYRYLPTRDYTVTLNTNGGTINSGNITSYTYLEGETLPTNVTRTNYTFMGWYDNSSFTGEPVTSITTTDLGDKEYWAKWTFVIYRTGDKENDSQIETFAGGTISEIIEYRMKVHDLNQWYSLSLPFTVNAVKVWDETEGAYYDLVPYYRTGGKFYVGHYVIRTPNKTTDFPISDFDNWEDPDSPTDYLPSKNTPYIIQWHDTYFEDKYISFFGASDQTIPTSMNEGSDPSSDNVLNVYGNDAMISGSVNGCYTLEPDYGGNGAWLRNDDSSERTVLPFECFIRAKEATRTRYRALRRGMTDTTTGIDPVSYDPSANVNKVLINGQIVIIRDNKMYNVMGMEVQQ